MHINPKRIKKRKHILQEEEEAEALNWRIEYDEDGDPLYILDLADGRQVTTNIKPPELAV